MNTPVGTECRGVCSLLNYYAFYWRLLNSHVCLCVAHRVVPVLAAVAVVARPVMAPAQSQRVPQGARNLARRTNLRLILFF